MNYDQILTYQCGGCKCEIGSKLEKKRMDEHVHQFFMDLDGDSYGTARSSLLSSEPLFMMNRVYPILVQEERVKTMARSPTDQGEIMALAA